MLDFPEGRQVAEGMRDCVAMFSTILLGSVWIGARAAAISRRAVLTIERVEFVLAQFLAGRQTIGRSGFVRREWMQINCAVGILGLPAHF